MADRGWEDSSGFPVPVEVRGSKEHDPQLKPSKSFSARQFARLCKEGRRRWAPRVDFKVPLLSDTAEGLPDEVLSETTLLSRLQGHNLCKAKVFVGDGGRAAGSGWVICCLKCGGYAWS
eukprot:7792586-Pyramimonas_sp.AAC.1